MTDAPYFAFWAKDWLTGEGTRLMTAEQKGAMIDLLCHAWLSEAEPCTIPSDDASLAKLSGLGRRWKANAAVIRAQFVATDSGRLTYLRLKSTLASIQSAHARRVSAGSKGGIAKAENAARHIVSASPAPAPLASNAVAMPEQCSSSQSQSQRKRKTKTVSPDGDAEKFPIAVYRWLWREYVARFGPVAFPRFCKAIKPCLAEPLNLRPGQLARAMIAYADEMAEAKTTGRPRIARVEYFAEGIVPLVTEGDLCAVQIIPDPSAFGMTDAERDAFVVRHQASLAARDAQILTRILAGESPAVAVA